VKNKITLIYKDECYQIIGVCFEVYNKIGYGHKEKFYQEAIAQEIFKRRKLNLKES
jgi:GxxExxY protein